MGLTREIPLMKQIFALSLLVLTASAQARFDVVYGKDNRLDVYQTNNTLFKKLATSTAGMIKTENLQKMSDGTYDIINKRTLEEVLNLCPSEAFAHQLLAPRCSGFLVAPDVLVTAGHCYNGQESSPAEACSNYSWVFGYEMTSERTDPTKRIPSQNVYKCKQVISSELNETLDFTIVKLDRPVTGREPLKFRTTGKISSSASLVVIGHPTGLPTKISDGGKVTRNTDTTRFSTNLDTFQGNSGSAVFDAKTGVIEGILVQGKSDYTRSNPYDSNSCIVVNKCDENGNNCSAGVQTGGVQYGEVVIRIESINAHLSKAIKGK